MPGTEIPDPQPNTPDSAAPRCGGNCQKVWKATKNAVTGALILALVIICAPVGL
jgi:hypothetical protein